MLGFCAGAAFLTHYFTLFITGAVLILVIWINLRGTGLSQVLTRMLGRT